VLYFDHNATSTLLPAARQAWLEATERFIGNPSSPHRVGARADAALAQAREKLAAILGCHALDLMFTSGATESANTVFYHATRTLPPDAEVWLSAIEHPCVTEAARRHFPKRHQCIPVTRGGQIDLDWLDVKLKRNRPGLLAVMAVNNETGVIQPTRELLALCQEHEIPFFCDAVQWLGKLPAGGLGGCTWLCGSAHKFGGSRGVGFLKCPAKGRVEPLIHGGAQEEGRRAGTENVAGVMAMIAALEAREQLMRAGTATYKLRDHFEQRLLKSLPGAAIVGATSPRAWNTSLALMPEVDCRTRWVVKLDKLGVAASTGSACASGKEEPSPVLTAMGHSPAEAARALRFSAGWETVEADWNKLLKALKQADRELRGK